MSDKKQTLADALMSWGLNGLISVSDDNLIELSIIVNRELKKRDLIL